MNGSVGERPTSERARQLSSVVDDGTGSDSVNLFTLSGSHLISHRCRIRCWVIEKYAPALRCQRYLFAIKFFARDRIGQQYRRNTPSPFLSSFNFSHWILENFKQWSQTVITWNVCWWCLVYLRPSTNNAFKVGAGKNLDIHWRLKATISGKLSLLRL